MEYTVMLESLPWARAIASIFLALSLAVLCVGWAGTGQRRGVALLEEDGGWPGSYILRAASPDVVPAQDVVVLPRGAQSSLQEVLGTVTGVTVTGELSPVGTPEAPEPQLMTGPTQVAGGVTLTGELSAVDPTEARATQLMTARAQVTAPAGSVSVAGAKVPAQGGVVAQAMAAAGSAAAQANAAMGNIQPQLSSKSELEQAPQRPPAREVEQAPQPHAASLHTVTSGSFNVGILWKAAQAAATDKERIHRLATSEEKIGTQQKDLASREENMGAKLSQQGLEETALTSVVKHNRLAINDLTEKLRRQKLIDEGQYGILYRRLTAVSVLLHI